MIYFYMSFFNGLNRDFHIYMHDHSHKPYIMGQLLFCLSSLRGAMTHLKGAGRLF